MTSLIEMEEQKTSASPNDDGPSNLNANTSQKEKDLKFLDLGWGLASIDLQNPYDIEFITLGYTMTSFILALMIVFIKSSVGVVIIAVVNVIFQISVFIFCVLKYQSRKKAKTKERQIAARISVERNVSTLSMRTNSGITRADSMSPTLAAEYVDDREQEKRRRRKLWRNKCLCFKKYHDFLASFDETFGRADDPVFIRPYYFRFMAVLYGVISSVYSLSIIAIYRDSPLNICPSSYVYDFIHTIYDSEHDKLPFADHIESFGVVQCACTTYINDFGAVYWLFLIGFSVFDSYELLPKYYSRTTNIMHKALTTFESNNIRELHDRVESSIYRDVKSKMQLVSNIGRVTGLYMVWCVSLFLWRYSIFGVISFPIVFGPIVEAVICANVTMTLFKGCVLSGYPLAISTIFGEPIYCQTSDDVLAWWQLRHIYETYRMPIYIKVLNPAIFSAFVFIVLLPFWAVMSMIADAKSGQKFYPYPVQFFVTIVLIVTILYCVKQFVASYEKQKTHIGMLQKEKIRLEVNRKDFVAIEKLIKVISEHMVQFDNPIYIGGVPMTNAVFILLRTAIGAVAMAIITQMVATQK